MSKILVVDDDADFVEAMASLLEASGYEVVTAGDGDEGFARARSEKPDLILLDVMMPNETEGFDAARKLHDDPATKRIPIIMITGIRRAQQLPSMFEPDSDWLPVKAVLEKPVRPGELLSKVKDVLSA